MQFGPYYCPSLSWEWGWGGPPPPAPTNTTLSSGFSQKTPLLVAWLPPVLLTYTTVWCRPSESQPAHTSSRRETPRAHSNRNSPPTSLFPLPHCATMQAGRYSFSLPRCAPALGEGTPVNIWLLVHYSFAFSSSTLALVLENCTQPAPFSSPMRLRKCEFDAKFPDCAELCSLITACLTPTGGNHAGCNPADSCRRAATTCFITIFALEGGEGDVLLAHFAAPLRV